MSAINYADTSIRYNQLNRTIEKFLMDLKSSKLVTFYLESCNVCAVCCGIEAVGGTFYSTLPELHGHTYMSQADLMFNYIYSNINQLPLKDNGAGLCENECIENLAYVIPKLSSCEAKYYYTSDTNLAVNNIIKELESNCAIVTSYKDNITQGHYICIVHYDKDTETFYYYDSWPSNPRNKRQGSLELISKTDLINCIKHRYMTIKNKEVAK